MEVPNKLYYNDVQSFLDAIDSTVAETDVVLDLGCGIVPMNYFRPKLHIMVEPWDEYSNVLRQRHADDKSVLIIKLGALEALSALHDNSVDSVFLLDVIEHLDKSVGFEVISEIERVAARQAIVFTPLGFMPQHMEAGEPDAWGLSGGEMQEHKSGWLPEDFDPAWEFHICETYHSKNFRGELLKTPYGAFFAVRNFEQVNHVPSSTISDIRRPLPSEVALQKLQISMSELVEKNRILEDQRSEFDRVRSEIASAWAEIEAAKDEMETDKAEVDAIRRTFLFRMLRKITNIVRR